MVSPQSCFHGSPLILINFIKQWELGIKMHYWQSRWGRFAKQLLLACSYVNEERGKKKKKKANEAISLLSCLHNCQVLRFKWGIYKFVQCCSLQLLSERFMGRLCCCRLTSAETAPMLVAVMFSRFCWKPALKTQVTHLFFLLFWCKKLYLFTLVSKEAALFF